MTQVGQFVRAEKKKISEVSDVNKEELISPTHPVRITAGKIGKIVRILKSERQNSMAGVLIQFGSHVKRPFWSSAFRCHFKLSNKIDIISPQSLTHVLTARHCCIYQSLQNISRYSTLTQELGCGFKFCTPKLTCSRTNNNFYFVLPRLDKDIDMLSMRVGKSIPSIPKANKDLH